MDINMGYGNCNSYCANNIIKQVYMAVAYVVVDSIFRIGMPLYVGF